jgi:hypothetical protein
MRKLIFTVTIVAEKTEMTERPEIDSEQPRRVVLVLTCEGDRNAWQPAIEQLSKYAQEFVAQHAMAMCAHDKVEDK